MGPYAALKRRSSTVRGPYGTTEVVPFPIRHLHGAQTPVPILSFRYTWNMPKFRDWQLTTGNWQLFL
jgi:hypothetical protein